MLLKEIDAIGDAYTDILGEETDDIIEKIVELPLRSACKRLKQKGIETIMSSANKNNLLKPGQKPIEKEDVYGSIEKVFENHTFLDAGVGYAWLMINFSTLSDENKEILFDLEEKLSNGDKLIWFVYPTELSGNIAHSLRIGKYTYEFLKSILDENDIPKGIEVDEMLIEFEKRHIVLLYPWIDTSTEAVILRMPIKDDTTVEEVEEYFNNLSSLFKSQLTEKTTIKK